jgi:dTDP-4-amino-4,6-dideoxygalactose transaminase
MTKTAATAAATLSDDPSAGPIPFIDLQAQRRRLGTRIDAAIARVLDHGRFIMGPEVRELEDRLADFCGSRHAIGCASGTDALQLALMALGVRPGDAVFIPSFTFASTAEVVAILGATPVFVDVLRDTFNMDPASLQAAVTAVENERALRPAGVIPVDLFGQPADYLAVERVADRHGLWILADAAQSFGATLHDRKVGTLARVTATSFFPAKPLGCYGDGGAVFTDDDDIAAMLRSVRVHGKGGDKYDNVRVGVNSRLDTLQAAILLEKLRIYGEEITARQRAAERYNAALGNVAAAPRLTAGATSVWAQYTLVLENRDAVARDLKAKGIPTAIYYPRPLHRQTAFQGFPGAPGGLPVSEHLAGRVLSLPMHPYLERETQDRVNDAVAAAAPA